MIYYDQTMIISLLKIKQVLQQSPMSLSSGFGAL